MRDPKRIDKLLAKIAVAWKANPDLRLGQLIANAVGIQHPVLFNTEDDQLEAAIDRWIG